MWTFCHVFWTSCHGFRTLWSGTLSRPKKLSTMWKQAHRSVYTPLLTQCQVNFICRYDGLHHAATSSAPTRADFNLHASSMRDLHLFAICTKIQLD